VLEHTPKPRQLVAEMARVLKKDGALILAAPFSFRLHEEPHDYFRYSPHGLSELCNEAGLAIERVEQVGSLWSLIGHQVNSYLALDVGRIGRGAPPMRKLRHETPRQRPARRSNGGSAPPKRRASGAPGYGRCRLSRRQSWRFQRQPGSWIDCFSNV